MSKELIKQRILKEKPKSEKEFSLFERTDPRDDELYAEVPENFFQDPNTFLLNNLLLTVQFFENYERDIKILRENWYKETSLELHRKKCFYADSLFRESGRKVKFSALHGINKSSKDSLHPLRIYIFSDNVKAAFDPTILRRVKKNVWPQYLFQVKMDEHDEKLGTASLILLKNSGSPKNRFDSATLVNENHNFPYVQEKSSNRPTIDKFSTSNNKELNFKIQDKRISLKYFKETEDGVLPPNSFYYFATPEESLNSVSIVKYRMNTTPTTNHEISQMCFQKESIDTNFKTRRIREGKFFTQRNILNSAAFKGYFCDVLIEKLAEPLGFDADDIQAGIVHEEFAVFGQQIKITHAIEISDWSRFISLTEHRFNAKFKPEVAWPTNQMWEIMNTLPCYTVPDGGLDLSRKNLDHEKKWKIVFPKNEEFLLLHMMHSQIRCYFFILSIYKSFIEPEINTASLGPKHLLHLLFWQVHKNFLAWPDERPAETLLNYLKILYKKLQNKFLRDFFINSRNLLANSFAKDIHKAQVLIKMILQNPVPYILRAIRNLEFDPNFYPAFEVLKFNAILRPNSIVNNRSKRLKKEKIEKKVCFQDVEERVWRQNIKQMQSLQKAEEQESRKNSISSIDTENIIHFDFRDSEKFSQILEMLILHYLEMGNVSIEFKFPTQAFMYLFQTRSLFELMSRVKLNKEDSKTLLQKIKKFKEKCDELERKEKLNQIKQISKTKLFANPAEKLKSQQQMIHTENKTPEKEQNNYEKNATKIKILKNSSDHLMDENDDWETQL